MKADLIYSSEIVTRNGWSAYQAVNDAFHEKKYPSSIQGDWRNFRRAYRSYYSSRRENARLRREYPDENL